MRRLVIFLAHIDDLEISSFGYIFKNYKKYDDIEFFLATNWSKKEDIFKENLKAIENRIGRTIKYTNFGYEQRKLTTYFDNLKDDFYKSFDFTTEITLLTHDSEDTHTDHTVINSIAMGLYKYCDRFITVYSPSSINFKSNYFIELAEEDYILKKECMDKYDISNEQSYSRLGYYLKSEEHYNIGRSYVLEKHAKALSASHWEVYRILKWAGK